MLAKIYGPLFGHVDIGTNLYIPELKHFKPFLSAEGLAQIRTSFL